MSRLFKTDGFDEQKSRRGFMSAIAVGIGLSQIGTAMTHNDVDKRLASGDNQISTTPPPYPADPYMQGAFGMQFLRENPRKGYMKTSRKQKLQTLLRLRSDVLAFDQLSTYMDGEVRTPERELKRLDIAHKLDRPATSGWNVNIKADTEEAKKRYGPLMDEKDWRYPDGTVLDSPRGILAETFGGEPQQISFTFNTLGIPSVFGPGGLDLLVEATDTRLQQGYSGFFVDGVGVFRFQGLDFSRWAQAAFQSHLESLSDERLKHLNIENPASFNIRDYLEQNELTPGDDTNPFEDPVFREYLIHHHEGINTWFEDYRTAIKERFPDRMSDNKIALYANQFTGHFSNPQAANVYISDSMDVIYTELYPRVDPPVDVNYKTMRSVGNFSKPVVGKGTLTSLSGDHLGAIDPETSNPNLLRFQAAEAYATGARFQLPITARAAFSEAESVTNWVEPDGTIPDQLQSFADFVWTHKRFLTELDPSGDVAIVWSLPTRVWRHEPSWYIGQTETPRFDSFLGTAALLRESGIPYDVLTFGHPRLWDDTAQLERITDYDAIVLPAVESITDEQISRLATYLDEGGTIINSGPIPDRDGFYEPRDDVASLLNHSNATILNDDPGRRREVDNERDKTLVDALKSYGIQPYRQTDNRFVAVHAHAQSDPQRTIIQLLNYDYDAATDSFASKTNIQLRLPKPDFDDTAIRYYSPQRQVQLEANREGEAVTVVVPELTEWGIVVMAESEEAFVAGDPEEAQSRLDEAKQQLTAAQEAGNEKEDGFIIAETQIEAAETALKNNAYAQALESAQEAVTAIDPLVPTETSTPTEAQNTATPTPTDTKTETATSTLTPTETQNTDTSIPTDSNIETTTSTSTSTEGGSGPGFTVFSGIVALLITAWRQIQETQEDP